jgi:predicted secreted Zn-dependent protease
MVSLSAKIARLLVLMLFGSMTVQAAQAEVFKYFDEEGTLIVTDDPFGTKKRDRRPYRSEQDKKNSVSLNRWENVDYQFYEVSGQTIHDAMSATERLGPYDPREGRNYAGQTRWKFGLSYTMDFSYHLESDLIIASVQISDIDFRSDIAVMLPSLTENSRFEPAELKAWEGFLQRLAEHEHDHVRIIQEPRFRQEVISGLSAIRELRLPGSSDSHAEAMVRAAAESEAGAVAHAVMRKIKQKNDEYDAVTDHGRKPELRNVFFQRL